MTQFHEVYSKVGLLFLICLTVTCNRLEQDVEARRLKTVPNAQSAEYGPPSILTTINDPNVKESSGLVASRTSPGYYWTHNDSGDGPFIYSFGLNGKSSGVWRVTGASAIDWEDIAAGPGPIPHRSYLYIGDIGDNNSIRETVVVYRVVEPLIRSESVTTKQRPGVTGPADVFRFRYPDGKHDAEALLIEPKSGDLYIITKVLLGRPGVYKAAAPLEKTQTIVLEKIASLRVPSLLGGVITGGDISPDGRRVALCDYLDGYELVLPKGSSNFDEIWKQRFTTLDVGKRTQGEAIAYRLDGRALLTTSEGQRSPVMQVERTK